jgi:S1/P1 Nuclease
MTLVEALRLKMLLIALVLFVLSPIEAFAWGYTGHRVITEITEQFLEPDPARKVRDLLAIENVTTLAEVSTWADQTRVQRPETKPWHYVNIPVHAPAGEPSGYDAVRDCPADACVVAKIGQFERVLADQQASPRQRLEALKYLVHFVGDVHQPLHTSDDHDRGGNDVPVTFMGRQTNLHAVWDTDIVETAMKGDERSYALRLTRNITQPELSQWSQGDVISWANESHEIATSAIYSELPHAGILPDSYEAQALPIVNEQLERAGIRLAKVLNDCLRQYGLSD